MNFLKRNIKEEYSVEDGSVLISNEDLSVTYYYDENGNKIEDNLSKVDLEEFETDSTIYFEISDTEEGRIRERHPPARRYDLYTSNSNEDSEEGSVILKPPSKISWPILGSIAVFMVNILFTGTVIFNRLTNKLTKSLSLTFSKTISLTNPCLTKEVNSTPF